MERQRAPIPDESRKALRIEHFVALAVIVAILVVVFAVL